MNYLQILICCVVIRTMLPGPLATADKLKNNIKKVMEVQEKSDNITETLSDDGLGNVNELGKFEDDILKEAEITAVVNNATEKTQKPNVIYNSARTKGKYKNYYKTKNKAEKNKLSNESDVVRDDNMPLRLTRTETEPESLKVDDTSKDVWLSLRKGLFKNDTCELAVRKGSEYNFSSLVLKHKYNFVHLKLTFRNFNVAEDKLVILYNRWVWTYDGQDGGYQLLFLPNDYGYLSFGLLWSYTLVEPLSIEINGSGNCNNLTGGLNADQKIGDALGQMTSKIAAVDDMYNSSYWCYSKRIRLTSGALFHACENSVCTVQTFEYNCCKYHVDPLSKERHVKCHLQHFRFGILWWLIPIHIGELLLAYYPLLLTFIGSKITSSPKYRKWKRVELEEVASSNESETVEFVHVLEHKPPVSFMASLCEPCLNCNLGSCIVIRLLRIFFIIFPLFLTSTRVFLDYMYARDLVRAAVKQGALLGFSTMIGDVTSAQYYFLWFFGGPYVALPCYLVFGCLMAGVPNNLEALLERGMTDFRGQIYVFLTLKTETKAALAGIQLRNTTGFKRIHKVVKSQVLMLLNRKFWKQTFKFFINRYKRIVCPVLFGYRFGKLLCLPVTLLYVVFSVTETVLTCSYFAFPVISCFFIFLTAYIRTILGFLNVRSGMKKLLAYFLIVIFSLLFSFTWYMYCLIFFDAFWFLTKIAMFTYSGLIAFPRLSDGYITLAFMTMYYIVESLKSFGEKYQDLLIASIKACKQVDDELFQQYGERRVVSDDGIPVTLWNRIIECHTPKRVQIAYTLFQLCLITLILAISVKLLYTFDRIRDLSLISHVFTALVICSLPKIVKSMCAEKMPYHKQKRLVQRIKETVHDYINNKTNEEQDSYLCNILTE